MPIGRHIWATLRWSRPVRPDLLHRPVLTIPRRRYLSNEPDPSIELAVVDAIASPTSASPSGSNNVNSKEPSSLDGNPPKKPKGTRKPKRRRAAKEQKAEGGQANKGTKRDGQGDENKPATQNRTKATAPRPHLPIFRSSPIPMGSHTDWLRDFVEESGVVPTLEQWRLLSKKSNVYRFPLTRKEFDDIISGVDVSGVPNWSTRGLNQRRKTAAFMKEVGAIDKKPYIFTIAGDENKNYPPSPVATQQYYTEDDICYEALCEALLMQSPGAIVSMMQIPQLRKFKIQYLHGVMKSGIEDRKLGINDDGTLFIANAAYGRRIVAGGFGKGWIRSYRVKQETRELLFIPHLAQKIIEQHEKELSRLQAQGSKILEDSETDFHLLEKERERALGVGYTGQALKRSPVLPEQLEASDEPLKSSDSHAVNEVSPTSDNDGKPIIELSGTKETEGLKPDVPIIPQPPLENPKADVAHDEKEGDIINESELTPTMAAQDHSELSILPTSEVTTDSKPVQPLTAYSQGDEMKEGQDIKNMDGSQENQKPEAPPPKEQIQVVQNDPINNAILDLPKKSAKEKEIADPSSSMQETMPSVDTENQLVSSDKHKLDTFSTSPPLPKPIDDGYEYLRQSMSTTEQGTDDTKVDGNEQTKDAYSEENIPRRSRRIF
ncbi:hypothetical protein AA313_de0209618 [Arthrobotrys entomopaga]|nr:hypothetical protein AA313_de0209618 [Arthrobotrys entomopaga]